MELFKELSVRLDNVRMEWAKIDGRISSVNDDIDRERKTLDFNRERMTIEDRAQAILKEYAKLSESFLRDRVDGIVTAGMRSIFEDETIECRLDFSIKRNQATVEPIMITRNGKTERNNRIADADSGGMANVAAFLYKIVALRLMTPRRRQILFADEPFRNLSRGRLYAAGVFVKEIAKRLGIQVVMVTHQPEHIDAGDVVYTFKNEQGQTVVERG